MPGGNVSESLADPKFLPVVQTIEPGKIFCNAIVEEPSGAEASVTGAGLWLLDKRTMQVLWINEPMEAIYGPLETIRGKTCYEAFRGRTTKCADCLPLKAAESGNIVSGYISRVTRGGIHRHYQVVEAPMIDETNQTSRVLEVLLDVTDKIQMQQALETSEREHRALFEHAGLAVGVNDRAGLMLKVNRTFEKLSGYRREEIEGRIRYDQFVHPKDRERLSQYTQDRLIEGRIPPNSYEFTFLNRWGEERQVQIVVNTLPNGNQICSLNDITERRKLEQEIRSKEQFLANILRHSIEAIVATDLKDDIRSWNRGAEIMFGYKPKEVLGRKFPLLLSPEFRRGPKLKRMVQRFQEEGFIRSFEAQAITREGKQLIVEITRSAIRDADGNEQGSSAIIRDITENRRMERQMVHREKMHALGELAASLAHEIKNPLNSMVVNMEVLKSHFEGLARERQEKLLRYVNILEAEVQRLDKVMKGVLDFARPMEAMFTEISLTDSIAHVLELVGAQARRAKVAIKTSIEPDLPKVQGAEDFMTQILLNLLLNAFQAMPKGGKITIKASRNRQDHAEVAVADTGCGIPRKYYRRVFDLYFSTKEKGSGLGLSLVKRLVTAQGGSIRFESQVNHGTRFIVTFPPA
jgi:PAS domain S-box-containing protein